MKQTVNFFDFKNAFVQCGRKNRFSHAAQQVLFEYLESLENDLGYEFELDAISLCCEYTEYRSFEDFQNDYGDEYEDIEDIMDDTLLIMIDDKSFIIANF